MIDNYVKTMRCKVCGCNFDLVQIVGSDIPLYTDYTICGDCIETAKLSSDRLVSLFIENLEYLYLEANNLYRYSKSFAFNIVNHTNGCDFEQITKDFIIDINELKEAMRETVDKLNDKYDYVLVKLSVAYLQQEILKNETKTLTKLELKEHYKIQENVFNLYNSYLKRNKVNKAKGIAVRYNKDDIDTLLTMQSIKNNRQYIVGQIADEHTRLINNYGINVLSHKLV